MIHRIFDLTTDNWVIQKRLDVDHQVLLSSALVAPDIVELQLVCLNGKIREELGTLFPNSTNRSAITSCLVLTRIDRLEKIQSHCTRSVVLDHWTTEHILPPPNNQETRHEMIKMTSPQLSVSLTCLLGCMKNPLS